MSVSPIVIDETGSLHQALESIVTGINDWVTTLENEIGAISSAVSGASTDGYLFFDEGSQGFDVRDINLPQGILSSSSVVTNNSIPVGNGSYVLSDSGVSIATSWSDTDYEVLTSKGLGAYLTTNYYTATQVDQKIAGFAGSDSLAAIASDMDSIVLSYQEPIMGAAQDDGHGTIDSVFYRVLTSNVSAMSPTSTSKDSVVLTLGYLNKNHVPVVYSANQPGNELAVGGLWISNS